MPSRMLRAVQVTTIATLILVLAGVSTACGDGDSLLESLTTPTPEATEVNLPSTTGEEESATPEAETNGAVEYTVQPGDTLGAIAVEFDVTVDAIAQANDIADPSLIVPGQVLQIPKE